MFSFAKRRPSAVIYAASLVGLLLSAVLIKIISYDMWWHLLTGRIITTLGIIPKYDIYSYTAFGASWINHEWLFEVIQWFAYENGGIAALIIMKFLLTAAAAGLLFETISFISSSRNAALWGTIIFLWASAYRILDRPFLAGMVLLAAFCLILHKYVSKGTKAIWALPLLMFFWVNVHGGAILGLEVVFAFAIGESLQAFAEKNFSGPESLPAKSRIILWIIALLCTLACIINPWGFDAFIFPFKHMQMNSILSNTLEWLPVLHPYLDGLIPPLIALVWFLLTAISFIFNTKKTRISHLILFIITALLLPKGHRFVPEFLIVNIPIAFYNFNCVIGNIFVSLRAKRGYLYSWIQIALAFVLSAMALTFGVPVTLSGEIQGTNGVGFDAFFVPSKMIDFLESHDIRGKVFNEIALGEQLIFRRWPKELVFIDGRTPVYGNEFIESYINAFRNPQNFEELDQKYHFDYIVLPAFMGWGHRFLHEHLWTGKTWKLVYAEYDGLIYLRNEPKFAKLIERFSFKKNPIIEMMGKK